jgi:hypothetical protein
MGRTSPELRPRSQKEFRRGSVEFSPDHLFVNWSGILLFLNLDRFGFFLFRLTVTG